LFSEVMDLPITVKLCRFSNNYLKEGLKTTG
jgi:hypothetical protein